MRIRPSSHRPCITRPDFRQAAATGRTSGSISHGANRRRAKRCPVWFLALLLVGFQTGCTGTSHVGLLPEYPPVKIKTFSLYSEYVEVDSLQPELRWQPLTISPQAFATNDRAATVKIEHITYELRIWNTAAGRSGKLVYAREDLREPYHKLEHPLKPDTRYLWSVRARFLLNGRPRAIEWSMAGYALRNEAVPNESCLRFQTPAIQQGLKR